MSSCSSSNPDTSKKQMIEISSKDVPILKEFPLLDTTNNKWLNLPSEILESKDPSEACIVIIFPMGEKEASSAHFNRKFCIHTVIFSPSIERINDMVFCSCEGLVDIKFSNNGELKTIGHGSFWGCIGLQHVSIPEGTITIHWGAFRRCKNLRTVEIPSTLINHLGSQDPMSRLRYSGHAFNECGKLEKVFIKELNSYIFDRSILPVEGGGPDQHGSNFQECLNAMIVLPSLIVRTLTGDEYHLDNIEIPAWNETARQKWRERYPETPMAPPLPVDLNVVLSAQNPDSDLYYPTHYELLAAEVGSNDCNVPLSPSIRGEAGATGLLRLFNGELDFNRIVAMFVESPTDDEDEED